MNETVTAALKGLRYGFGVAEPKWQRAWDKRGRFGVDVPTGDKPT